jgi:hypothetical protein
MSLTHFLLQLLALLLLLLLLMQRLRKLQREAPLVSHSAQSGFVRGHQVVVAAFGHARLQAMQARVAMVNLRGTVAT